MDTRNEMLNSFYSQFNEDSRLKESRQGQLEYAMTMKYVHKYLNKNSKIIEIGSGTGRYSIALAKEGLDVTAVELVQSNLDVLRENSKDLGTLNSFQGDATDLSRFEDNSFDLTLSFGPMYHLYDEKDVHKAIDEAIRITKPGGTIIFAFLSIYGIMLSNYIYDNWSVGQKENFTKDYVPIHFEQQLFTGYDVSEFEDLFEKKSVEYITTAGVDASFELMEKCSNFAFSDEDFKSFISWYVNFCEKRELLGGTNHLIYICKKK